jgi:hypothetical protein
VVLDVRLGRRGWAACCCSSFRAVRWTLPRWRSRATAGRHRARVAALRARRNPPSPTQWNRTLTQMQSQKPGLPPDHRATPAQSLHRGPVRTLPAGQVVGAVHRRVDGAAQVRPAVRQGCVMPAWWSRLNRTPVRGLAPMRRCPPNRDPRGPVTCPHVPHRSSAPVMGWVSVRLSSAAMAKRGCASPTASSIAAGRAQEARA